MVANVNSEMRGGSLTGKAIRITAVTGICLACTAMSAGAEEPEPDAILEAKTIGDVTLRAHVFYPDGAPPEDPRPGIVFFYGGGWQGFWPRQFYRQCRFLADRGMVAIAGEYRTKNEHGVEPLECVKDAKATMRWVKRNAGILGIDPDRLAAGGASAGSQLAAMTAVPGGLNHADDDLSVSPRPSAVILYAAVLDTGPDGFVHDWVKPYWRDFSPIHNINASTPPTLIILGGEDGITSEETAREYQRRLEEAGVRCDVRIYPGQPHRFYVYSISEKYFRETLGEVERFLDSLGYLEAADGKP